MAIGLIPTVAYIDPTGGLPPSMWALVLAPLLAAAGAVIIIIKAFGRRLWPTVRWLAPFAIIIIAGVIVMLISARSSNEGANGPKIVILGMDGLEPALVRQYMKEARMPNFSRLAASGTFHELRSTIPPQSPVAWASFITGAGPEAHGIYDFIWRDPDTYKPELAIAGRKKVATPWDGAPWWNAAAIQKAGLTALRVPLTFPPLKVNGRMLSGMGVWDARGTEGTYFFYSTGALPADPRGMVFKLERSGDVLRGAIPGPYRAGEEDTVREPFELASQGDKAELRVQGRALSLAEGRWSDWLHIEFRLGRLQLQKVQTVTRVLYRRRGEDVTLYVSPLNFDPAAPLFDISYPKDYAGELARAIGCYHTRGMPFDTHALSDGALSDDDFLSHWDGIFAECEKTLDYELARFKGGLLIAYFEAPDSAQHMFWWTIDPEHPARRAAGEAAAARYKDVIPKCYERCDAVLGRVMAAVGERGTVVVLSDHGFASFRKAVHLNAILRDLGFLALEGDARTSPEFLKNVDWSRTQAYALGFNAVYLNIAGREGKGCVPTKDADALTRRIAAALEAFKDPETGEQLIKKAYIADDVYAGHRSVVRPDIVVGYRRGYRASWQTALGAVPEGLVEANTNKWSGDHCVDRDEVPGIFLCSDRALDAQSIADVGPAVVGYQVRAARARE